MVKLLPDAQDTIEVPIEELISMREAHIPGSDLAQRPLNEAQVTSLEMSDAATWPKVLLTRTDLGLIVVDGLHRREAAKRKRLTRMKATIRPFASEDDLIEAAFRANIGHGLPANKENRSAYAYWLFCTHPTMEQKEIADRVGIKPSTVNASIKRREQKRAAAQKAAEERQHAIELGWKADKLDKDAQENAHEESLTRAIRAYVRQSVRLYEELRHLDNGPRYWLLEGAIKESDKTTLYRMVSLIERYLKESLPPDLTRSLATRGRKQQQQKDTNPRKIPPQEG